MEDEKIIALFYERSEQAIHELSRKHGAAVRRVAGNILGSRQDAEECENDTYLGCWNTIPPQRPRPLVTYVCRIAKNLALTRYHANTAQKRSSCYDVVLDELAECIPGGSTPEDDYTVKELSSAVNAFLGSLDRQDRIMFVRRCWFSDPVSVIAEDMGLKASHVSSRLFRTRQKLYGYLKEEGYLT